MLKIHSFFYISGHCPTLSNPKPLTLNTMYLLHLCKRVVRKAPRVNCAHVYRAYGADPVNEMSLRAFRLKARGSELLIPRSRCGDVAADSSSLAAARRAVPNVPCSHVFGKHGGACGNMQRNGRRQEAVLKMWSLSLHQDQAP